MKKLLLFALIVLFIPTAAFAAFRTDKLTAPIIIGTATTANMSASADYSTDAGTLGGKSEGSLDVNSASTAGHASTADDATNAGYATSAGDAATLGGVAEADLSVSTADYSTDAGTLGGVAEADLSVSTADISLDNKFEDSGSGIKTVDDKSIGVGAAASDTEALNVSGNLKVADSDYITFGAIDVDGSWRFKVSGNALVFEVRDSGEWTNQGEIIPE